MDQPTLIYCAAGNARFQQIAIDAGFLSGAQLPHTIYFPPYFVDQNWKKPNQEAYIEALKKHRPFMASVLDWERDAQLPEVLGWAEGVAQFVETVMIIPKVQGGVSRLPRAIGGKPVRLGYSVPTRHGGTALPYEAFRGWPVHLLGGSPHKQMRLTMFMNVVSVDGNMHHKMAHKCQFWRREKGTHGHFVNMNEAGDGEWGIDANYEAFRRSCKNIIEAWKNLYL
jgi:hypothetical protein